MDGTDSRLRLVPGYRKRLRDPVIHALDHVVALVDGLPATVATRPEDYRNDPRLAAMFAPPNAISNSAPARGHLEVALESTTLALLVLVVQVATGRTDGAADQGAFAGITTE